MQLSSGMIYLHNQNVIHRDLSARNVLCKEEDGQLTVKVADFGLSRLVKEDYYLSETVSLPVKWCAIEVLKFRKFTTKSDVWSFGVLMWEIYEHGASKSLIVCLVTFKQYHIQNSVIQKQWLK